MGNRRVLRYAVRTASTAFLYSYIQLFNSGSRKEAGFCVSHPAENRDLATMLTACLSPLRGARTRTLMKEKAGWEMKPTVQIQDDSRYPAGCKMQFDPRAALFCFPSDLTSWNTYCFKTINFVNGHFPCTHLHCTHLAPGEDRRLHLDPHGCDWHVGSGNQIRVF